MWLQSGNKTYLTVPPLPYWRRITWPQKRTQRSAHFRGFLVRCSYSITGCLLCVFWKQWTVFVTFFLWLSAAVLGQWDSVYFQSAELSENDNALSLILSLLVVSVIKQCKIFVDRLIGSLRLVCLLTFRQFSLKCVRNLKVLQPGNR